MGIEAPFFRESLKHVGKHELDVVDKSAGKKEGVNKKEEVYSNYAKFNMITNTLSLPVELADANGNLISLNEMDTDQVESIAHVLFHAYVDGGFKNNQH